MIGILLAAFFTLTSPVTPAVHVPFAVADNGGALLTRQPLTPGQVVYTGGIAETVHVVHADGGTYEFTVTPGLPASDRGKTVTFST